MKAQGTLGPKASQHISGFEPGDTDHGMPTRNPRILKPDMPVGDQVGMGQSLKQLNLQQHLF